MWSVVYNFIFYILVNKIKKLFVKRPVGNLVAVWNNKPHPAENSQYLYVRALMNDEPVDLLMTFREYDIMSERADNNREDFS